MTRRNEGAGIGKEKKIAKNMTAPRRLAWSVAAALCAFAALWSFDITGSALLVSWDVGAGTYLALAWTTIARSNPRETRLHARSQDVAAYLIFVTVVVAAFASIAAITLLLSDVKDLEPLPKTAHIALAVVALLASWLLIHTIYTFHYARLFYSDSEDRSDRRGLEFPGGNDPDYFDFAYYSFVVGMTSQVSDVAVSSHHLRRSTLLHGILSFVFNVAVLALSVNIIVSVI